MMSLLRRYVERHNEGVRTGDFDPMLALFHPDAVFEFVGFGPGALEGLPRITQAFEGMPPTDELVILKSWAEGAGVAAVYGWGQDPRAHGELRIEGGADGAIRRVTVQRDR